MNNILMYISLGTHLFVLIKVLKDQFSKPTTLDADLVWAEVQPIIAELNLDFKIHISYTIAEKTTRYVVDLVKSVAPPSTSITK